MVYFKNIILNENVILVLLEIFLLVALLYMMFINKSALLEDEIIGNIRNNLKLMLV